MTTNQSELPCPLCGANQNMEPIIKRAVIRELKNIWNETQPDIVPKGWEPETQEAWLVRDRIRELQRQLKEGEQNEQVTD